MNDFISKHIKVYGIVQGVGFRPTVSRHAISTCIKGSVCNKGPFVEIFAGGNKEQVEGFIRLLKEEPPKRSAILKIDVKDTSVNLEGLEDFKIIESEKTEGEIFVSPDIAMCDECREELKNPKDRRYRHPFINCTSCGPRLTILEHLPYDRHRTSMKKFPMCKACNDEYVSPKSRRYDAQPVCCNDCGPYFYSLDMNTGKPVIIDEKNRGLAAIKQAAALVANGKIIAIKGIGGFHLCCDGANEEAVKRLRILKNRPMKPWAVMMKDLDTVKRECLLKKGQEEIISGHQKPILILEKTANGNLCESISPDNDTVGVMLPYAPVHELLFEFISEILGDKFKDILVMTSGNVRGAPICHNDEESYNQLKIFADGILSNNRDILIRTDDSVMDYLQGKPYMIRRSRGYAPIPFMVSCNFKGQVLAIGGELKNTFCIGKNDVFYPSSYVGDLADIRTIKALKDGIKRMQDLLECKFDVVVCDKHPLYNSRMVAKEMADNLGIPCLEIQHHYAHILSCMAENDVSEKVIGISMDGTGYGDDESIWGGEILICDYDGYERKNHIKPFFQMGGDSSSKEGYKIAVSMIYGLYEKEEADSIITALDLCDEKDLKLLYMMYDRRMNGTISTSCGRLFDGVCAVLGIRKKSTFEGEGAIALETYAKRYMKKKGLLDSLESDVNLASKINKKIDINDTDILFKYLVMERLKGKDAEELAYVFHISLADMIISSVLKIRDEEGINIAAISGGVFQNKILTSHVKMKLENKGIKVLLHELLPPNDGGIALGQAVYAMKKLSKNNGNM